MPEETLTSTSADLTNCDREPIHIPGAILPHGAMLVLQSETFEVLQVAGDLQGLLGVSSETLLGASIDRIFSPEQIEHLRHLNATFDLIKPRHLLDPLFRIIKVDLPRFSGEALAHLPACFRIELGW
jgi:light-regulated signal transduction histidine kinase (bacteriophytochrome)